VNKMLLPPMKGHGVASLQMIAAKISSWMGHLKLRLRKQKHILWLITAILF